MDEFKKELEDKHRREMALKMQEFQQQAMLTKQATDEERARLMIENLTLSDVTNKELRAMYVSYTGMLDVMLSTVSEHKNQTQSMKKGSSFMDGMFGGGTTLLKNEDKVLFTKIQVIACSCFFVCNSSV
jgi:hypothetical protein